MQLLWRLSRGYEPALHRRMTDLGLVDTSAPCVWEHGVFVRQEPSAGSGCLRLCHVLRFPTGDLITINELFSEGDKGDRPAASERRPALDDVPRPA